MKLILCVDDRGGMLFNRRRQSRDRVLISDLAEYVGDGVLYMNSYSEELFSDVSLNIILCDSPMASADVGDFAFVERESPREYAPSAEEIILYKWNKNYPSDLKMGFLPEELGFSLSEMREFEGSSHEKITREIYRK